MTNYSRELGDYERLPWRVTYWTRCRTVRKLIKKLPASNCLDDPVIAR